MAEKLKKTKSYFTIKEKRHQNAPEGTIFERDYMTLNSLGEWHGKTFPYGETNFKMVSSNEFNVARKHSFGKWAKTTDGDTVWNYNDLDAVAQKTNDEDNTNIKIKPNKNSLLSFAYYGSCTEVVKNTITSIIKNFPGELFVGQVMKGEAVSYLNEKCRLENPFNIDITSDNGNGEEWKTFVDGFTLYEVLDASGNKVGDVAWSVEHLNVNLKCLQNGDIINQITIMEDFIINEIYFNGERVLLTDAKFNGYHIRLKHDYVEKLIKSYDELQQILLNFNSKPLYTAILDYPHEDSETGKIVTYQKTFTWPTRGGWNLDISSNRYEKYIGGLLDIASFYDEYYTDNIWRSMTHEAIKNMDRAYVEEASQAEEYSEGITRMEALLHSYGAFFDKFKFCIDALKNRNKITYDGNNNSSDYFLYEQNELSGWDTSSPISSLKDIATVASNFDDANLSLTTTDGERRFLQTLKLNSKSILSKKGTRNGIEELLALFGMESEDHAQSREQADYSITEYVTILKPNENSTFAVDEEETFPVEKWNQLKKTFPESTDGGIEDTLEGLPVRIVYYNNKKYLIPWFFTGSTIDGEPYFQMYGGWGKRYKKEVETDNGKIAITQGVFDETEKYLKYATNISVLENMLKNKVEQDDIFYVSDISDYLNLSEKPETVSNYFRCKDLENYSDIEKGWENIPIADINSGTTEWGIKVLYLESLIDEINGNNPHAGFGKYDDGSEYYKIFKQIFKYSIENDNFYDAAYTCDGDLESEIINAGFEGAETLIRDNVKCWYFSPNDSGDSEVKLVCTNNSGVSYNNGAEKYENGDTFLASDLNPYDYETGEISSREMASYSVMNTKRMEIHFYIDKFKNNTEFIEDYKSFINNDVLPYLKQIIPSTTIWWLRIGDEVIKE